MDRKKERKSKQDMKKERENYGFFHDLSPLHVNVPSETESKKQTPLKRKTIKGRQRSH